MSYIVRSAFEVDLSLEKLSSIFKLDVHIGLYGEHSHVITRWKGILKLISVVGIYLGSIDAE